MNNKNVTITLIPTWAIIAVITFVIGYAETGQLLGGAIALAVTLIAIIASLIGFIPVGGPIIYWLWLWPAIAGISTGYSMPITLLIIYILTMLMAVIYTIIGAIVGLIILATLIS